MGPTGPAGESEMVGARGEEGQRPPAVSQLLASEPAGLESGFLPCPPLQHLFPLRSPSPSPRWVPHHFLCSQDPEIRNLDGFPLPMNLGWKCFSLSRKETERWRGSPGNLSSPAGPPRCPVPRPRGDGAAPPDLLPTRPCGLAGWLLYQAASCGQGNPELPVGSECGDCISPTKSPPGQIMKFGTSHWAGQRRSLGGDLPICLSQPVHHILMGEPPPCWGPAPLPSGWDPAFPALVPLPVGDAAAPGRDSAQLRSQAQPLRGPASHGGRCMSGIPSVRGPTWPTFGARALSLTSLSTFVLLTFFFKAYLLQREKEQAWGTGKKV